ncbi:hypothetical protein ACPCHT_27365 [Nucisporomicrobium flavum]|uniref:hypothetical protein n=1 Tax=Nucisporomicrobium flavum TaxID=2785915 RepID=UPI003C2F1CE7
MDMQKSGYPYAQLAAAFVTAAIHEDAATRERADGRVRRWVQVLRAVASGAVRPGSRTPVAGLPAWVTPEVVRGGFATGTPAAAGPLRPHEIRPGFATDRAAPFAYHLTEAGQAELGALLDSGGYRLELPEQAALLTVAWLLRTGDRAAALALVDEIGPYAGRLCFTPVPDPAGGHDPELVWRADAGQVSAALAGRRENPRVAAMREALTVWNPLADEFLTLWLDTRDAGGTVAAVFPPGWRDRARGLLGRYGQLAAAHTHCGKHRRPKENLAVLRAATEQAVADGELTPRALGLLRHVAGSMLARRGVPGSPEHAALRERQAREARVPAHHVLARVVVSRLAALDPGRGVPDVDALCVPVRGAEAETHAVAAGTPIPPSIRGVVRRARAGRIPELIEAGVVPSAEVLAQLVPQIAAETSAAAYRDPALRALMAATYRAFRNRRSLLLLNLESQVRLSELPWVAAVGPYREAGDDTRRDAHATLRRLGELAIDGFPGTLLPNPLIRELAALSREADAGLPWVEELAADIFMGTFSPKFLRAARLAGELLEGSLYARYYDIDYAAVAAPDADFERLCRSRTGAWRHTFTVAAGGMLIEQGQILTTHNLATLVRAGVAPAGDWATLARRAFEAGCRLTARLPGNPRPLPTIKDIAYAWRNVIFYLAVPGAAGPGPVLDDFEATLAAARPAVRDRLTPAVTGLRHIADGGRFAADGTTAAGGRRLEGWTTTRHWLQELQQPGRRLMR